MDARELIKLGFNINSIGLDYWLMAIKYYQSRNINNDLKIGDIYKYVADMFNTEWTRVEKNMRFAKIGAIDNLKHYFDYQGTMTNKTLLKLLVKYYNKEINNHIPRID